MKLKPDCIRDVLMSIEEKPFPKRYSFQQLSALLSKYSDEDIYYTCLKLHEGGYIILSLAGYTKENFPRINTIDDLTFQGHQFLEDIKDDSSWNKVLKLAKAAGSFSISTLASAASSIIQSQLISLL